MALPDPAEAPRPGWGKRLRVWLQGGDQVRSAPAFRRFLAENAAFIAQKTAYDYCRGKTGTNSYALFGEKDFLAAMTICRWETMAVVLQDLLILGEAYLRPAVATTSADAAAEIARWYAAELAAHPLPEHRAEEGWRDVLAAFSLRYAAARSDAAWRPRDVVDHSAQRLYETIPIHTRFRQFDADAVRASMAFQFVAFWQKMERRVDRAAVAASFDGGAAPAA